jgi:hypothetical protein
MWLEELPLRGFDADAEEEQVLMEDVFRIYWHFQENVVIWMSKVLTALHRPLFWEILGGEHKIFFKVLPFQQKNAGNVLGVIVNSALMCNHTFWKKFCQCFVPWRR